MKNLLSCRVAACAIALLTAAGIIVFGGLTSRADGEVEINETNFPDEAFREYVRKAFDSDEDGVLDAYDIEKATEIWPSGIDTEFTSFQGIELLTNAKKFSYTFGKIDSIDLSKNINLEEVCIDYTSVKSLNISGCKKLIKLECVDCDLPVIDVSNNSELQLLRVYGNNLKSLDVTNNHKLVTLDCSYDGDIKPDYPKLTSLDLSLNPLLKELDCSGNDITDLDLSDKKELVKLSCAGCEIKNLDLSSSTKLEELSCPNCKIDKINLTGLKDLKIIWAISNNLTKIDLSTNTALVEVALYGNKLNEINFGESTKLETAYLQNNKLKSLDVSDLPSLNYLSVQNNELESLDLTNNPNIYEVLCQNNKISDLQLGNTEKWFYLNCENNMISEIIVPDCIHGMYTAGNKIDKLDISKNEVLKQTYLEGDFSTGKNSDGTIYYSYFYGNPDASTDSSRQDNGYLSFDASTELYDGNPASLKLDKISGNIVCGKTLSLKATLTGSKDTIIWKSSDKSIASVDKNGKVKGKMAGTVTITVEAAGRRATCTVQVLYKDVKNEKDFWYKPTYFLTDKNIVKGYDKQTKFKPANECTRAQMLTFIWRLMGEPTPSSDKCKFPDVKKNDYFFKPVIWAVDEGITTGYSDGTFKPQNVCTRAQTVTFLWRLAGTPEPEMSTNKFSDVDEDDYFYKPVLWASEVKIVAGYKDGTFKPQGKCLRRQMVTFLYKYYNNVLFV